MLVRKSWFRLLTVALALACANALFIYVPSDSFRSEAIKAIQGSTLLFAICAALSIALFSNYVKGIREAYLKRVADVRDRLENFFDEHGKSNDPDVQKILMDCIVPLLNLTTRQWMVFDPINEIMDKITEPATKLHTREKTFIPRHLLRIEDEINEIGLLYIRRVISGIHLKTISGTFILVAVGMLTLGFSYLIPAGRMSDLVIVNISTTIVVLAVLELLLILSYLQQEGREEQPEIDDEDDQSHVAQ